MALGRAVFWQRAGERVVWREEILAEWAGMSCSSTVCGGGKGAGKVDETCGVQGSAVVYLPCTCYEIWTHGRWDTASLSTARDLCSIQIPLFIWRRFLGGRTYYKLKLELNWNTHFNFWVCCRLSLSSGKWCSQNQRPLDFLQILDPSWTSCALLWGMACCGHQWNQQHCCGLLVASKVFAFRSIAICPFITCKWRVTVLPRIIKSYGARILGQFSWVI